VLLRKTTVHKDQTMKPKPFVLSGAIILLTSVASYAGNGYFNAVLRNVGYGFSDGYHAERYCLTECSCSDCSPMQEPPMMQQEILPQPMLAPPEMHQAMMRYPTTQQPVMRYPMTAPGLQSATCEYPEAGYPVAYPVTQGYWLWYPSFAPAFRQVVTPAVAIPNRTPAVHR
jgi:hypothetical protein